MTIDMKACPFCGAEAKRNGIMASCSNRVCPIYDREMLTHFWNCRPANKEHKALSIALHDLKCASGNH